MRRAFLCVIAIFAVAFAEAQEVLKSVKMIERWVDESVKFSPSANMSRLTAEIEYTLLWDVESGEIKGVRPSKGQYHWFALAMRNLNQIKDKPLVKLKKGNSGSVTLRYDFTRKIDPEKRHYYTKIESFTMPIYKGDDGGDLWIEESVSREKLLTLYARGVEEVNGRIMVGTNGLERRQKSLFYYYGDTNRRVVVKRSDDPSLPQVKWTPLVVNGEHRDYYGSYVVKLAELFSDEEREEAKLHLDEEQPEEVDRSKPFLFAETMPEFRGGDLQSFRNWVFMQVKYPVELAKQKVQGTVIVSFVVNQMGGVEDIEVVESPHIEFSEMVTGIIQKSDGMWKPAEQGGWAVKLKYTIPFQFRLK